MKTLRSQQIGVLALQETHLTTELADQIDNLYSCRISLFNSPALENPSSSAGVAFVINKEKLNAKETTLTTLIPGRAVFLSVKRQRGDSLHLINIYALNAPHQHPTFWSDITTKWQENNLPCPHLVMGDFNLVEDPLDRSPVRPDNEPAITALCTCRQTLGIQDTWRKMFPTEHSFTFSSSQNTLSRLD